MTIWVRKVHVSLFFLNSILNLQKPALKKDNGAK